MHYLTYVYPQIIKHTWLVYHRHFSANFHLNRCRGGGMEPQACNDIKVRSVPTATDDHPRRRPLWWLVMWVVVRWAASQRTPRRPGVRRDRCDRELKHGLFACGGWHSVRVFQAANDRRWDNYCRSALHETVATVSLNTVPRLSRQSCRLWVGKLRRGGGRAVSPTQCAFTWDQMTWHLDD